MRRDAHMHSIACDVARAHVQLNTHDIMHDACMCVCVCMINAMRYYVVAAHTIINYYYIIIIIIMRTHVRTMIILNLCVHIG